MAKSTSKVSPEGSDLAGTNSESDHSGEQPDERASAQSCSTVDTSSQIARALSDHLLITMLNESQTTQASDDSSTDEASSDVWERAVEFDFANWITLSALLALREANRKSKTVTPDLYHKLIDEAYENRRYVPFGGKLEQLIGDAVLKLETAKFCVVECKALLVGEEWNREAQSSAAVPGGKGRQEVLTKLESRALELGNKCHYLVGFAKTKKDMGLLRYWDFIRDGPYPDPKTIQQNSTALTAMEGICFEEMVEYLKALIEAGGRSVQDAKVQFIAIDQDGLRHAWRTTVDKINLAFKQLGPLHARQVLANAAAAGRKNPPQPNEAADPRKKPQRSV